MKILQILFFTLLITSYTQSLCAQTFNLGRFSIGESRIHVELEDFLIHKNSEKIKARWIQQSVQWLRNENNLLVPRSILKIAVADTSGLIHFEYQGKTIIPVQSNKQVYSEVYIDLFNPDTLLIYRGSELMDKIVIEAGPAKKARAKQLIDYSCSPYLISINGIDDEYLSLGCKMHKMGTFGKEHPRLEVTMSSTNLRPLSGAKPPYTIYFEKSSGVLLNMKDHAGKVRTLQMQATLPQSLPRLKTSFGIGPYLYESRSASSVQNANFAPSFMLYGKFDLTDTASLKAFDALLYSKSYFNNSGLYFSYDLASAFDERLLINALLGFQGLHYRYRNGDKTIFRLIYPQGFEVIYKHAFQENYALTYGMFLSTGDETYTNAWIRYGKRAFLEFNYINWAHQQSEIKMWGLSVGIPLLNLL
jgi:hypothetical protein